MTYDGGVYGIPWYTEAGMLYYRRDLLEKSGFSQPPGTWDELKEQASTVRQGSGTRYGFVSQEADCEGGGVDALGCIRTSGGNVLEADEVIIDSPEEQEVGTIFPGGSAVFMRNVPRFFALASDPAEPSVDPEQIEAAALPVSREGLQSYSSLGGWNLSS